MKTRTVVLLVASLAGCSVEQKSLGLTSGRHHNFQTKALTLERDTSAQGLCQFSVRHAGVTKTVVVQARRTLVMPGVSASATSCAQAIDGEEKDGDHFLDGCQLEPVT